MNIKFMIIKEYLMKNKSKLFDFVLIILMATIAIFRIKVQQSVGIDFDEVERSVFDSKFFENNSTERKMLYI